MVSQKAREKDTQADSCLSYASLELALAVSSTMELTGMPYIFTLLDMLSILSGDWRNAGQPKRQKVLNPCMNFKSFSSLSQFMHWILETYSLLGIIVNKKQRDKVLRDD